MNMQTIQSTQEKAPLPPPSSPTSPTKGIRTDATGKDLQPPLKMSSLIPELLDQSSTGSLKLSGGISKSSGRGGQLLRLPLNYTSQPTPSPPAHAPSSPSSVTLRVDVISCRNLSIPSSLRGLGATSEIGGGVSDFEWFCSVVVGRKKQDTKVVSGTMAPKFDQSLKVR